MFITPMVENFTDNCEIVGIFDSNIGRAKNIADKYGLPVFEDFEDMILKTSPDRVIVTTVDAYHSDYIIKAISVVGTQE